MLGAGEGLLLIVLAAAAAGNLDRWSVTDAVSFTVAVLSGLTLLWGAATLLRRMPIGRLLLTTTAATIGVGAVVLLLVQPSPPAWILDVVTGVLLVGLQTVIISCALSLPTLLWIVGGPGPRRDR
jgi:Na+-driven multidrug efflux pump